MKYNLIGLPNMVSVVLPKTSRRVVRRLVIRYEDALALQKFKENDSPSAFPRMFGGITACRHLREVGLLKKIDEGMYVLSEDAKKSMYIPVYRDEEKRHWLF